MSSEEIGLASDQRIDNGLNSPLVFPGDSLRYRCGATQSRVGDPGSKTRELGDLFDEKMFSVDRDRFFAAQGVEFRRNVYGDCSDQRNPPAARNWNGNGTATPSGDESDGEDGEDDEEVDDDDDDDDDVEGGGDVERIVDVNDASKGNSNPNSINDINNNSVSGGNLASAVDGITNGKAQHRSSYGSSREVLGKDGEIGPTLNNSRGNEGDHQQERLDKSQNAVTIAETDCEEYYSHYLQGTEGSASVQKAIAGENGCGFSGRKDVIYSSESGDSLRAVLSDPITGSLMDDAMILPCGHSFGGGGIQHVIRMKACCTCSQPISEESISPNLSLRVAVQAYRREEDSLFYRSSKRRRERIDQGCYGDSTVMEQPRGRGVQFPFAVMDRVIIKGNKRTPQRFVGREAIVTTQCLNGWYVVKTLDNAESVKLQYRSLAKVSDDPSKPASGKVGPNWL
ncbi:U-box domain-containing protein 62 isoform X2 [Prosopis cineraria]|uniref:U-box domain-containing protein 62 isoform X2 n=1 Tax=Prosopis cineraria TaxID=364024 RepID=UPI0024101C51|nr:U-box domain-containing protein 62 isoform X2 [Prosopis cineraria]